MTSTNKTCKNCSQSFLIEPDDFTFYEKIGVPPPTWCPDCRFQRRSAWRNHITLYTRQCELCKKSVVTLYSPESKIVVYCNKCWWSDAWDPKDYAMDYDLGRSFFEQFNELMLKVPHLATVNDNGVASLNCEYTHDCWFAKNCYMVFSAWHIENVMYSAYFAPGSKDVMDCLNVLAPTQWQYECINCDESYRLKNSQASVACTDSAFLYDCRNCFNCFMCTGLRNKKYHFKNQQYSKEEYEKILKEYHLETCSGVQKAQAEYDQFILDYPRRFAYIYQSLNSTGDLLYNAKNSKLCFNVPGTENCKFIDNGDRPKDTYDCSTTGELSECYDGITVDHSQRNFWGIFTVKSQDVQYTQHCHSSKHLFGCIGLRSAEYCILNKQYSKEDYQSLKAKIMEDMKNRGEYGEFYPAKFSPFGYNETVAPDHFSLTKEEAIEKGFKWQDNTQRTTGKETIKPEDVPDAIADIQDSITNEILKCVGCERNYKIIPNELLFYQQMALPIPRMCFYCRHAARIARRNPYKLWHRKCAKCDNEFETSYSPKRKEIVYCESCYQAEIS